MEARLSKEELKTTLLSFKKIKVQGWTDWSMVKFYLDLYHLIEDDLLLEVGEFGQCKIYHISFTLILKTNKPHSSNCKIIFKILKTCKINLSKFKILNKTK